MIYALNVKLEITQPLNLHTIIISVYGALITVKE